MTDKELRKLNRRELLQIMLDQGKAAEETMQNLNDTTAELEELKNNYERLKKRLDQKDIQIRQLTETLQSERTKREIELQEAGSIAEAALRLNGVFETAQKAAEQYIYNVRLLSEQQRRAQADSVSEESAKMSEEETLREKEEEKQTGQEPLAIRREDGQTEKEPAENRQTDRFAAENGLTEKQ